MAISTEEFMKSFMKLVPAINNKNVTLPKAISIITTFIATIEKKMKNTWMFATQFKHVLIIKTIYLAE